MEGIPGKRWWEGHWRGLGDQSYVTSTHQRPGMWEGACFDWSDCRLQYEGKEGCEVEEPDRCGWASGPGRILPIPPK